MDPSAAEVSGTATQPVPKSGFSDMAGYGWAEGYVKYAVQHGVTKGYPDGTFKPGNKVTMNELITMVLRAAAYTDENLGGTWPSNYIGKAAELEIFGLIPAPLPQLATKWMAAQLTFNTLAKIEAANPPEEVPGQGTDQDKPDAIPDTASMTYANSSVNGTFDGYDGKTISSNVKVYTYGKLKNYSSTMTFSKKLTDYREGAIYKYKNVKTPAFYRLTDGKITEMVVPMDVGFDGRAYSVINGTVTSLNADGDSVNGIGTLTAGIEITWLGEEGLTGIPIALEYLEGEIYELNLSAGEVQSIYTVADADKVGDVFDEISTTGAGFVEVESYDGGVVKVTAADGGAMFSVKTNATVYVLEDDDATEYKTGKTSNIRSGFKIRAYDISDDDETSADLVVVLKQ